MRRHSLLRCDRPFIGERPINTIGAADGLATLQPLGAAGKLDAAHRLRSTIGGVTKSDLATIPVRAVRGAILSLSFQGRACSEWPGPESRWLMREVRCQQVIH